jgi:hypothetical protein
MAAREAWEEGWPGLESAQKRGQTTGSLPSGQ